MSKKLTIPSYKKMLATRKHEIEKRIRATKRPIFNLWRLVRDPCHRFGGDLHKHQDTWAAVTIAGVGALCLAAMAPQAPYFLWIEFQLPHPDTFRFVARLLCFLWVFAHAMRARAWNAHADELAIERERLTKQLLLPGTLLQDLLHDDLGHVRERLFGEKSGLLKWRNTLDARKPSEDLPEEPPKQATKPRDPGSYRHPPGGIRIDCTDDRTQVRRATVGLHAFERHARERLEKLMADAHTIGAALDAYLSTKDLPLAQTSGKESLNRIDAAIQDGVNAFYTELSELEENALQACTEAAIALTANVATETEEVVSTIRGEDLLHAKRS